jgi:nicotinic acid mononucleotide adenylyltransferase
MVKKLLSEDFAKNERDFSLAIGMDNANTFDKWVNHQDLERMIDV